MYISYGEYLDYGGDIAEEFAFDRFNFRVDKIIDTVTHGRVKGENPVRECVKRLAFELIAIISASSSASTASAGVSSVSNDGVSVSYTTAEQADASLKAQISALAAEYLAGETDKDGVCLLYAGVMG